MATTTGQKFIGTWKCEKDSIGPIESYEQLLKIAGELVLFMLFMCWH